MCQFEEVPNADEVLVLASANGESAIRGPLSRREALGLGKIELRLAPAARICGTVQTTTGLPIGGAIVELDPARGPVPMACSSNTSSTGSFEFVPIPRLLLSASIAISVTAPGFQPKVESVATDELPEHGVVMVLSFGCEVRGRCVTRQGHPVEHVKVIWPGVSSAVETAQDGRFRLRSALVNCEALVCIVDGRTVTRVSRGGEAGRAIVEYGDIVLADGQPIGGVVTDREGLPIANAKITLCYAAVGPLEAGGSHGGGVYTVGETVTGTAGEFRLEAVGSVSHELEVQGPQSKSGDDGTILLRRGGIVGGRTDLRLVVGGRTILIKCVDSVGGEPIAVEGLVLVKLLKPGEVTNWEGPLVDGIGVNGRRVPVEDAGRYDVEVEALGFHPGKVVGVDVVEDDEVSISVILVRKLGSER